MISAFSPLVSVVICFHNEEAFLKEAVESVINQSYKNWELILVDDGSTDASTSMAKEIATSTAFRIKYEEHQNHENIGLSPSRNLGIAKASGDYIAFLDADDVWEKEKLANQMKIFEENPEVNVVVEPSLYWHSWNSSRKDKIKKVGVCGNRVYQPPQLALQLYPLSTGISPCPSSMIVKKVAIQEVNGFENSFTGIYALFEDQAFLFKIYLSQRIFVSSQCNSRYRQRNGSIIHRAKVNNEKHFVKHFFLKWAKAYLRKQNYCSKEVDKLLSKALYISYRIILRKRLDRFKNEIVKIFSLRFGLFKKQIIKGTSTP